MGILSEYMKDFVWDFVWDLVWLWRILFYLMGNDDMFYILIGDDFVWVRCWLMIMSFDDALEVKLHYKVMHAYL